MLVDEPSRPIATDDLFNDDSIKVCFLKMEGETLFYDVEVPKLLRVRPPDLRRFAYDHKKVESLVANCVKDNAYRYAFEPLNESLLKNIEQELFVALQDLNSVLKLLSVECNLMPQGSPSDISVRVEFEHKNGERRVVVMSFNNDMVIQPDR